MTGWTVWNVSCLGPERLHCSSWQGRGKWSQQEVGGGGAGVWVALLVWVPWIEWQGPEEYPGAFREDIHYKESWINSTRGASRDLMDPIVSHKISRCGPSQNSGWVLLFPLTPWVCTRPLAKLYTISAHKQARPWGRNWMVAIKLVMFLPLSRVGVCM